MGLLLKIKLNEILYVKYLEQYLKNSTKWVFAVVSIL